MRGITVQKTMTPKQIRLLQLLDEQILACTDCDLHKNGRAKPYWSPNSQYVIIGEAPGKDEVTLNEPFVGRAGNILWNNMTALKMDFLVINSVNCRPVNGTKNGKPTEEQKFHCRKWRNKYITVLEPKLIFALGDHAVSCLLPETSGSVKNNATMFYSVGYNADVVRSVHPAYALYNSEQGTKLLKESITLFDKLRNMFTKPM
jgi:uracil-DNA glycosylase